MSEPQYTIDVNDSRYQLNEEFRASIQQRAEREFAENEFVSCWWRVADSSDGNDTDSVHEQGDPILVIETVGPIVPWEKLDQLELEMKDTDSFQEHDTGSGSDVDEGNGMRTIKPGEVNDSDEEREIPRTHFGITPNSYEEMPSPDGESEDTVPQEPVEFDEPTLVKWVPDNPDITHSWETGRAMVSVDSWVEWNVQQRADQPRTEEGDDWNNHYESLLQMHDCEKVAELQPNQSPPDGNDEPSGSQQRKGKDWFEGNAVGDRWNV
jgi:hypothetical protein